MEKQSIPFEGRDVPQANVIGNIPGFLEAISEGDTTNLALRNRFLIADSTVDYYCTFARSLGFLSMDGKGERILLLPAENLLTSTVREAERMIEYHVTIVSPFFRALFAAQIQSAAEIQDFIHINTNLALTTVNRRTQAVVAILRDMGRGQPPTFPQGFPGHRSKKQRVEIGAANIDTMMGLLWILMRKPLRVSDLGSHWRAPNQIVECLNKIQILGLAECLPDHFWGLTPNGHQLAALSEKELMHELSVNRAGQNN